MRTLSANDLVLQLVAPYNAPVMEVWLASLVGRTVVGVDGNWKDPMVYDVFDGELNRVGGRATRVMMPNPSEKERWDQWLTAIRTEFIERLNIDIAPDVLALALAEELKGKKSRGRGDQTKRRNIVAAIPLVPASATLQNQPGVVGSFQYNDYDLVIEQAFALGRLADEEGKDSAGGLLMSAMTQIISSDQFLGPLNSAIAKGILASFDDSVRRIGGDLWVGSNALPSRVEPSPHMLIHRGTATPFHWFNRSWNALMSEPWIDALPPRRWVDWSIAVIRLGIGMGLLWTNRWYEEIARIVVNKDIPLDSDMEFLDLLKSQMQDVELLRWPDWHESSANRNVKSQFDQSFRRGMNASFVISDSELREERKSLSISDYLTMLRNDHARISQLESALASNFEGNRSVRNLRYTAMDLLAARVQSKSGDDPEGADHYSLLRHAGRGKGESLTFEPTTEIVAVVASLACGTPSRAATLGDVARELASLGLRPTVSELRRHLERAGLSRAVADASLQVEVRSAFGGGAA